MQEELAFAEAQNEAHCSGTKTQSVKEHATLVHLLPFLKAKQSECNIEQILFSFSPLL